MTKLALLALFSAGFVGPAALLAACATDNGDAVHGPQFGPPPERPEGGSDGSVTGEGGGPSPDGSTDGGGDADAAPTPTCTSGEIVAVLAGTDGALSGAVQVNAGAWAGAAITGGGAKSAPSLVAFGTGFVGLTRGPSDALQAVSYTTSWSGVTAVGALTTLGTPALTVLGANAQAVYLAGAGADVNKFSRIQNSATSWTTTGDPVMPPAGTQSFGPSAGAIAAAGADLVFAQDGDNGGLYVRKWDGAVWSPELGLAVAAPGTTFKDVSPALVSVPGTFDLVLLYPESAGPHVIGFATRNATTKAWSSAAVTHATAQTGEAMSAALVSPTSVVVTFRGNDSKAYTMIGTLGAAAVTWSAPVALLADGSATVDSSPAVAKGVCGDTAIAVFASSGQVKATRLRAGAWSVPGTVTGASGTRVSVATR
jgi:hypothetical protein